MDLTMSMSILAEIIIKLSDSHLLSLGTNTER